MMADMMADTVQDGQREKRLVITLDGPAASGKSSVARRVAEVLKIPYVSSGLLYRVATLLTLEHGLDLEDEAAILALLYRHKVELKASARESNQVWVDGGNLSHALHTDRVDAAVSAVARHERVRDWVRERLRDIKSDFVIEGRDMGTVVFPHASHKFYLTAPAEVRARRRVGERAAGLAEVTEALKRRDALDHKQLVPAADALPINTAHLSVDEVVARVLGQVRETAPLP
jgi:cytidylate kinase